MALASLDGGKIVSKGLLLVSLLGGESREEELLRLGSSDNPPDIARFLVRPNLDKASILDLSGVGSLKEMLRLGIFREVSSKG